MKRLLVLCALLWTGAGASARAQVAFSTGAPPPVFASTATNFGARLDENVGPWVIGDVRFQGNLIIPEFELMPKVRARRGVLYTPADVAGDVQSLQAIASLGAVTAAVFAVSDDPAPQQYSTIAVSTSMVRLVFFISEKPPSIQKVAVSTGPAVRPEDKVPPAVVSGVVMTPTAYRGLGRHNRPGLGLDFNAVYYIGRLYGKNSLNYTTTKTNYIDRIGQWFLTADGKMQLQSEGDIRPAAAVGSQAVFSFRDAGQPSIATPGVTVNVSRKTTRVLTDAYFVVSKKVGPVRSSVGYMQGNAGEQIGFLSEFLSDQALLFNGHQNQSAQSKSVFFASLFMLPKPAYPLAIEFVKPNGMPLGPYLLNMKLGYFLHLNFDLAYLKYAGGWDLLGMFQFRFNYFPKN